MDDSLPLLVPDDGWGEITIEKNSSEEISSGEQRAKSSRKLFKVVGRRGLYVGSVFVLWLSTVVVSAGIWSHYGLHQRTLTTVGASQMTYSPAQSEIEYFVLTFQQNISEVHRDFRDPDTVDEAWLGLYARELFGRSTKVITADNFTQ